jgi:biopolymer transport protein ExbB/TolQ
MPLHTTLVLFLLAAGLIFTAVVAFYHIYRFIGKVALPVKYFWSEGQSLSRVKEKIASERILLARDEVFDVHTLGEIKNAASPKSLIYDRLQTIANLQKSYARIDLDVLQTATQTKESASKTFEIPGYFVGFAMLIGLLGTVVGFAAMLNNMQETLTLTQRNLDFVESGKKIAEVLASMQSAFAATIGGLFCSMVASLLNYVMRISQARFHEKFDIFTVEEVLPLVYRSRDASDLLKDANENIEKTFSKLDNIGRDMLGNTNKLNAVHESFNTIITNLERITQSPHRDEMEQIVRQLSQVITETVRVNQSVQNTVQYIPRAIEVMERHNPRNFDRSNGVRETAYANEKEARRDRFAGYTPPPAAPLKSSLDTTQPPLHRQMKEEAKSTLQGLFSGPRGMIIAITLAFLLLVGLIAWATAG